MMKLVPTHDLNLLAALPAPPSAPVPCFYGRRFLTARELVQTGLVRSPVMIRRLIAEARLPPPLRIGRKLRVWDCTELQNLIDRLANERDKVPEAEASGENTVDAEAEEDGRQTVDDDDKRRRSSSCTG